MTPVRVAVSGLFVLALSGCGIIEEAPKVDYDGPVVSAARSATTTALEAELDAFAGRAPGLHQTGSGAEDMCFPQPSAERRAEQAYVCKLRLLRTHSFGGEFRPGASRIAEALAPGSCPGGPNNAERRLRQSQVPEHVLGADGTCTSTLVPIGVTAAHWMNADTAAPHTPGADFLGAWLSEHWKPGCERWDRYCHVSAIDGEHAIATVPSGQRWLVLVRIDATYHLEPWP